MNFRVKFNKFEIHPCQSFKIEDSKKVCTGETLELILWQSNECGDNYTTQVAYFYFDDHLNEWKLCLLEEFFVLVNEKQYLYVMDMLGLAYKYLNLYYI